jgi:hypothetical protein
MARKSSQEGDPPNHRGRLQAQGGNTEESEPWARDTPPTKAEMLAMLERLWNRLSGSEQEEREACYEEVQRYIQRAPASGINAPFSKSFRNRKRKGGVRIDLEIRTGRACADDPS